MVIKTSRHYDLACGLAILTKYDDLDLISRSQVSQNHKPQIVLRFLSTLRVTGVYYFKKHNMMFVILYLIASYLSIYSSCLYIQLVPVFCTIHCCSNNISDSSPKKSFLKKRSKTWFNDVNL